MKPQMQKTKHKWEEEKRSLKEITPFKIFWIFLSHSAISSSIFRCWSDCKHKQKIKTVWIFPGFWSRMKLLSKPSNP